MDDAALIRRQFLMRAGGALAVAMSPSLTNQEPAAASPADDPSSASQGHPVDRVAMLCVLRAATARG